METELKLGIAAIVSPLELPYLQEWVDWHREIGIDEFHLVLNDWGQKDLSDFEKMFWKGFGEGWMRVYRLDGLNKQLEAYNCVLDVLRGQDSPDWIAFIDVDEFIRPRGKRKLRDVLVPFKDIPAIGLNWRLYGSSGHEDVKDGNYSVLERFKMCGRELNHHVKTIVNMSYWRRVKGLGPVFLNPHCLFSFANGHYQIVTEVDLEWNEFKGPFQEKNLDKVREFELAHYVVKSREECRIRRSYRRADTGQVRPEGPDAFFKEWDINEVSEEGLNYED